MLQKDSYNMGTVNDVQEKNRRCRLYSRCKYPAGPWDINNGPHYTLVWTYLLWNDSQPCGERRHEPIVIWGTKLKTSPLQGCYRTIHTIHKQQDWVGQNMKIFAYYNYINHAYLKVAFFRKCNSFFKSPKEITPNHYPELEIWISCLLLWAGISNFKFRIVIWSNFFWRFENWISLSEKSHL